MCANSYAISELSDLFSPIQLGVGVPGGCEAAVHAARRYAEDMPDDHFIVKLDFSNVFNSLHRDACSRLSLIAFHPFTNSATYVTANHLS